MRFPRLLAWALPALALLACSSKNDETPAPTPETGVDAPLDTRTDGPSDVADAKADHGPIAPVITCGPGPWVDSAIVLMGRTFAAPGELIPRGKVTISPCPEAATSADSEGYLDVKLTKDSIVSARVEAAGHLPTRWPEQVVRSWTADQIGGYALMDKVKPQLPTFATDKPLLLVLVSADYGSTGACALANDVTLTVDGHPEAVVAYHGAVTPFPPAPSETKTTASGIATVSGLTASASTKLTVKGTKTGCDVVLGVTPGTAIAENGVVSLVYMLVRDSLPTCGEEPHVRLGGTVNTRELDGSAGTPLAGVEVGFNEACPGVTAKTDSTGAWQAWAPSGPAFAERYVLPDYITVNSLRGTWSSSYTTISMNLRKRSVWATPELMPGFDDTHGFASIGLGVPKTGPCSSPIGVSFAVKGHPEAKITYTDGEPPKAVTGTATTKRGSAYVSGLKPGNLTVGEITATGAAGTTCTWLPAGDGTALTGGGELTLYSFSTK